MIHIAIVEDNPEECRALQQHLDTYKEKNQVALARTSFINGEAFLDAGRKDFDIIFMDIELGGINGIETAKKIREYDKETVIVLITNLMQYAIQGYSIQASDYIIKPISYEDFENKMHELCKLVERRHLFITLKSGRDYKKYNISDIRYVEVYGHQLFIHSNNVKEQVSGTLAQMEKTLTSYGFVKCNKCYHVNLEYVDGIVGDNVEVDGELLKISRREKNNFIHELTQFTRG